MINVIENSSILLVQN